jgi:drug/metabolite transporter (DMT)-like permease
MGLSIQSAWPWIVLIIAQIAMSSGGVLFALLDNTPSFLRASWRLFLTSLLQLPFMIYEYRKQDKDFHSRWYSSMPRMIASGVMLGLHFASWSKSIQLTSLSHALLFVSTSPLIIVAFSFFQYHVIMCKSKYPTSVPNRFLKILAISDHQIENNHPPTVYEFVGTFIGFLAIVLLSADAAMVVSDPSSSGMKFDPAPSFVGDFCAFLGAVTIAVYLGIGGSLRGWMPLFLYACPVTFFGALVTVLLSVLFEPVSFALSQPDTNIAGWLISGPLFAITLAAAVFPGMLGHTAANYCLKYLEPLVLAIFSLFEPFFGVLLGYAAGLALPGPLAWAAMPILVVGASLVSLGGRESSSKVWLDNVFSKCQRSSRMQPLEEPEPVPDNLSSDGGGGA